MQARMKNPVMVIPDALQAMLALGKSTESAGVAPRTLALVHLRASQINAWNRINVTIRQVAGAVPR